MGKYGCQVHTPASSELTFMEYFKIKIYDNYQYLRRVVSFVFIVCDSFLRRYSGSSYKIDMEDMFSCWQSSGLFLLLYILFECFSCVFQL